MRSLIGLATVLLTLRGATADDAPPPTPPPDGKPATSSSSTPPDPVLSPEVAAQIWKDAEAKVAARDYKAALDLYPRAYKALKSDRGFLTDYAQCSFLGKEYTRAESLLKKALDGADAIFLDSPKGREAVQLLPKAQAAVQQEKVERQRAAALLVESVIKSLPRHVELAKLDWVRTKANNFTPSAKYDDLPVMAIATILNDQKHVVVSVFETYEEQAVAEGRVKAIAATIRGEKAVWEKLFIHRTKDLKPELHEVAESRVLEHDGWTEKYPRTTFCWAPGTAASMERSAIATLELHSPSSDATVKKEGLTLWRVTLTLDSSSLK